MYSYVPTAHGALPSCSSDAAAPKSARKPRASLPIQEHVPCAKVLTPYDSTSLVEVEERLLAFERRYEKSAVPFDSKFTRKDLAKVMERLAHDLHSAVAATAGPDRVDPSDGKASRVCRSNGKGPGPKSAAIQASRLRTSLPVRTWPPRAR